MNLNVSEIVENSSKLLRFGLGHNGPKVSTLNKLSDNLKLFFIVKHLEKYQNLYNNQDLAISKRSTSKRSTYKK